MDKKSFENEINKEMVSLSYECIFSNSLSPSKFLLHIHFPIGLSKTYTSFSCSKNIFVIFKLDTKLQERVSTLWGVNDSLYTVFLGNRNFKNSQPTDEN